MRSPFRAICATLAVVGLVFFCSCDQHKVGELPEVQKEHVVVGQEKEGVPHESGSPKQENSPTPAEFFPEKKSP